MSDTPDRPPTLKDVQERINAGDIEGARATFNAGIKFVSDEPKFCVTCMHLIGVRHSQEPGKWRCGHPNNIAEEKLNLVTGVARRIFIYENLEVLRDKDSPCGPAGIWYEKYEEPDYHLGKLAEKSTKPKGMFSADDL